MSTTKDAAITVSIEDAASAVAPAAAESPVVPNINSDNLTSTVLVQATVQQPEDTSSSVSNSSSFAETAPATNIMQKASETDNRTSRVVAEDSPSESTVAVEPRTETPVATAMRVMVAAAAAAIGGGGGNSVGADESVDGEMPPVAATNETLVTGPALTLDAPQAAERGIAPPATLENISTAIQQAPAPRKTSMAAAVAAMGAAAFAAIGGGESPPPALPPLSTPSPPSQLETTASAATSADTSVPLDAVVTSNSSAIAGNALRTVAPQALEQTNTTRRLLQRSDGPLAYLFCHHGDALATEGSVHRSDDMHDGKLALAAVGSSTDDNVTSSEASHGSVSGDARAPAGWAVCAELVAPGEYARVCGRRQCHPQVDRCLLDVASAVAAAAEPAARSETTDKTIILMTNSTTASQTDTNATPFTPWTPMVRGMGSSVARQGRQRWRRLRRSWRRRRLHPRCDAVSPRPAWFASFGGGATTRARLDVLQCEPLPSEEVDDQPSGELGQETGSLRSWASQATQKLRGLFHGEPSPPPEAEAPISTTPAAAVAPAAASAAPAAAPTAAPTTKRPRRRRADVCEWTEPFYQCDAYKGAVLSEVWRLVGTRLAAKLNFADVDVPEVPVAAQQQHVPASDSGAGSSEGTNGSGGGGRSKSGGGPEPTFEWRHCADEGEICFCAGDVRFSIVSGAGGSGGGSGAGSRAGGVCWASEVVSVRHGMIGCNAALFTGTEAPPSPAECAGTRAHRECECLSADLRGPLVVPGRVSVTPRKQTSAEHTVRPRFLHGAPYPSKFRNGQIFDYAWMGAGARLVGSADGLRKPHNILSSDSSEYLLAPCASRPWFVVSFLEDLHLEHIGLHSLEFFASEFRHLQILGSSTYPTKQWRLLAEIETNPSHTHELFDIGSCCRHQTDMCWVRFLKVRTLSHHRLGDNTFCALTRFQAFGSTQMNFIAEERKKEDEIDSKLEPSIADVVLWHDSLVRSALASPFVGSLSSGAGTGTGSTNGGSNTGGGGGGPGGGASSAAAADTVVVTEQSALAAEGVGSTSGLLMYEAGVASNETVGGAPPAPLTEAGGSSSAGGQLDTEQGRIANGWPQLDLVSQLAMMLGGDSSDLEPAALSSGELLKVILNGTSSLASSSPVASAVGENKLHVGTARASRVVTSLVSLLGRWVVNATSFRPVAACRDPGQTSPSTIESTRPTPVKTSSSTPELVRMRNDLRVVQDGQVQLQEHMQSLAESLGAGMLLIMGAMQEQTARLQTLEEGHSVPSAWWYADGLGAGCGMGVEPEADSDGPPPHGALQVLWRLQSSCSPDRVVLILLVLWNILGYLRARAEASQRGRLRSSPPALPMNQPPALTAEATEYVFEDAQMYAVPPASPPLGAQASGFHDIAMPQDVHPSFRDRSSGLANRHYRRHQPTPLRLPPATKNRRGGIGRMSGDGGILSGLGGSAPSLTSTQLVRDPRAGAMMANRHGHPIFSPQLGALEGGGGLSGDGSGHGGGGAGSVVSRLESSDTHEDESMASSGSAHFESSLPRDLCYTAGSDATGTEDDEEVSPALPPRGGTAEWESGQPKSQLLSSANAGVAAGVFAGCGSGEASGDTGGYTTAPMSPPQLPHPSPAGSKGQTRRRGVRRHASLARRHPRVLARPKVPSSKEGD
eukprot:TRINITY_DN41417_c0_g1_i1.p1 TRINITY_DN41417_c0_g1~~TRINITY_DN41417_c0_g1_i1.p1  ORF type:complete len:1861 (-),score=276.43 TRINITY_DN41417_c0_g1_i1:108-5057(-)